MSSSGGRQTARKSVGQAATVQRTKDARAARLESEQKEQERVRLEKNANKAQEGRDRSDAIKVRLTANRKHWLVRGYRRKKGDRWSRKRH